MDGSEVTRRHFLPDFHGFYVPNVPASRIHGDDCLGREMFFFRMRRRQSSNGNMGKLFNILIRVLEAGWEPDFSVGEEKNLFPPAPNQIIPWSTSLLPNH